MGYTDDQLNWIYDRSGGDCHLCGRRLAFKNYGKYGERAAWEVEHSIARARGGTNRLSNLYPACISCNRAKRDGCTRAVRRVNGMTRSPLSKAKRDHLREENTIGGVLGGGLAGLAVGGPVGALVGVIIGGFAGNEIRVR